MLSQFSDIIPQISNENPHFAKIFEKHEELNRLIDEIEAGRGHLEQVELEKHKKEKLKLKDEAFAIITEYKKAKGS